MKSLWIVVALGIFTLTACGGGSDDTPPDGGNPPPVGSTLSTELSGSQTVDALVFDGEAQLAATTSGLLWRADADEQWQTRSPLSEPVTALTVIGQSHYLVAFAGDESAPAPLYVTTDSGLTWQAVSHNFGGTEPSPIRALRYDSTTDQIYALGADALAVADRSAQDWILLAGRWDAFATGLNLLRIDPIGNAIWYGGQGAIENGFLVRYDRDTQEQQRWDDLLPNPSSFKGGLIHPTDQQLVLFSGEGGIVRSTDHGGNWTLPLGDVNHRFYFDIVLADSGVLYTAGYDKGSPTQNLIVECSSDNGFSWHRNDFSEATSRGGVKSLMLVDEVGTTKLYLGLWENGIKSVDLSDLQCS
ncbi:hypothetical protein [Pseudidiomarina sp. CB1]|uniref:hypothetical protein n=1 Tax=Pseudidiomarina sp. CB1 TaxID=2972484 RepID=UPI00216143DE|nr:hypothetical protein [Pseudidiomarina sp. CB1]